MQSGGDERGKSPASEASLLLSQTKENKQNQAIKTEPTPAKEVGSIFLERIYFLYDTDKLNFFVHLFLMLFLLNHR
jgi:hypothetical protein